MDADVPSASDRWNGTFTGTLTVGVVISLPVCPTRNPDGVALPNGGSCKPPGNAPPATSPLTVTPTAFCGPNELSVPVNRRLSDVETEPAGPVMMKSSKAALADEACEKEKPKGGGPGLSEVREVRERTSPGAADAKSS